MRVNLTNSNNPFYNYAVKAAMEAPEKVPGTVAALMGFYALPLFKHIALLWSEAMIAPILVCALVFLTQPAAKSEQLDTPSDKSSMKYLVIALFLSQMTVTAEWAYLREDHSLSMNVQQKVGLAMMMAGLVIRISAIVQLREFFDNTIRILVDHKIIQSGIYRYVRHGSYTGVYFIALGIGVYLSAWAGVVISAVILGVAYRYRIKHEENALVAHFGDEYRDYQKRTSMLIPFIF